MCVCVFGGRLSMCVCVCVWGEVKCVYVCCYSSFLHMFTYSVNSHA